MSRPAENPGERNTPETRLLAAGQQWAVSEYVCTAGPSERPFEERHDHVTIAAVIEGSFNYAADTGRAVLHPGAFLLGNFGTCYECGHDHSRGDRCIAFHLAPECFSEVAASAAGSSRFTFSTAMLPAIPQVLPWFVWLETRASRADNFEIDEQVPDLIEAVIDAASGSTPVLQRISPRDERRVREALHYIELHAEEALNLDAVAGIAAMSKYHFLRTFRRIVGMTPYKFLLSVRMRRAAVRLATTSQSVSAIAFDTGFGDLSTFNARFRVAFGVSPTAYRSTERVARVFSPN